MECRLEINFKTKFAKVFTAAEKYGIIKYAVRQKMSYERKSL